MADSADKGNPFEAYATNIPTNAEKKISDLLLNNYKGKILELYIGDQAETINFDDYSIPRNSSIFGKLVDVLDRFVIFDCFYIDSKSKNVRSGNICYINFFQIRAFTELNGAGSLNDIFLGTKEAEKVRNALLKHGHIKK